MQMILVGDFFQLFPVSNKIIRCMATFRALVLRQTKFNNMFPHKVMINEIHRKNKEEIFLLVSKN